MYVLFVCSGNTCRSPMAEAIMQRIVDDRGLDWTVRSAGLRAGAATAPAAIRALRRRSLEPMSRPVQLTEQMVRDASIVLCMTDDQRSVIAAAVPESAATVYGWGPFVAQRVGARFQMPDPILRQSYEDASPYDIPDPIGQPDEIYEQTAATIEYLAALTADILTSAGSAC